MSDVVLFIFPLGLSILQKRACLKSGMAREGKMGPLINLEV